MGSRSATVAARGGADFADELADRLSVVDESVLAAYVDGSPPSEDQLLAALARATAAGRMHPVVLGAALTGVGVPDVLAAVATYLPPSGGSPDDPLHASVFKIERDPSGHPLAYVRMRGGTLTSRDDVVRHHRGRDSTVTAVPGRAQRVATYAAGAATTETTAVAGDIAAVVGLPDAEIGDQLGRWDAAYGLRVFPPPGLESVVVARDPADRARLFEAVQRLSAQDPLIDARLDGADQELTVSLYGEVQREVLTARLAEEFGIAADVARVADRARRAGRRRRRVGAAGPDRQRQRGRTGSSPGRPESGERYVMDTERGYILPAHHRAIEETVPRVMASGLLGWRVVDWVVTLTNARFSAPTPPAGYYRDLTETRAAPGPARGGYAGVRARQHVRGRGAGGVVHRGAARADRGRRDAGPAGVLAGRCTVTGRIPTRSVHGVERGLPELTGGRGFLVSEPAGYERI